MGRGSSSIEEWIKKLGDYIALSEKGSLVEAADLVGAEEIASFLRTIHRNPEPSLINLPTRGQLKNALDETTIDPGKPTVVMVHGWNPTLVGNASAFIGDMAQAMVNSGVDANILWWDWLNAATAMTPREAPMINAIREGDALGEALVTLLGSGYDEAFHFVGHSLGTRVVKHAADTIHSNGFDWNKTHVTMLDPAELGDLDYGPNGDSIPNNAAWIGNYISAFGGLHPEAANVILREGMPITISPGLISFFLDLADFHSYPQDWYTQTILDPQGSIMGHGWSFERGGVAGAPEAGRCFVQTLSLSDSELALEEISWAQANTIIVSRNVLYIAESALLLSDLTRGPVKAVGSMFTDFVEVLRGILGMRSS